MKKKAVIFGGSKGIGYATAIRLAQEQWEVVVVGSNEERLEKAASAAYKVNVHLDTICCDVRDEEKIKCIFETLKKQGGVQLFVNCVGKNYSNLLVKKKSDCVVSMPFEKWKECIDINLNSLFLCVREEAKYMINNGINGIIVNVSTSLRNGGYGQSVYLAAKAAITSLTKSWAIELAKYGIRVGCIAPGAIEGQALIDACNKNEAHAKYMKHLKEQIPLKRFAYEEEVAEAILFIANNEYFTGSTIDLDGGGLPPKVVL